MVLVLLASAKRHWQFLEVFGDLAWTWVILVNRERLLYSIPVTWRCLFGHCFVCIRSKIWPKKGLLSLATQTRPRPWVHWFSSWWPEGTWRQPVRLADDSQIHRFPGFASMHWWKGFERVPALPKKASQLKIVQDFLKEDSSQQCGIRFPGDLAYQQNCNGKRWEV